MDLPDRKISFEKWWPNLRRTGYVVTSAEDRIWGYKHKSPKSLVSYERTKYKIYLVAK